MTIESGVLRHLFDLLPDPVVLVGTNNELIDASASVEELLGWHRDEFVGRSVLALVHPDDVALALVSVEGMRRNDVGPPMELRLALAGGGWKYVEMVARNLIDDPQVGGLLLSVRDTTQRRAYELEHDSTERFRLLVQYSAGILLVLDPDGCVRTTSGGWVRALGHNTDDIIGALFTSFVVPADRPRVVADLARATTGRQVLHSEARLTSADGVTVTPYALAVVNLLDDPLVGGFVVTAHDITDLDEARRSLEHLATHDPLTGLANRVLLSGRLRELLGARDGSDHSVALLFVDLDGFKQVNDALGHHAGDEVLVRLAERLTSAVTADDLVARLGGDEFVILVVRPAGVDVVTELERACTGAIGRPFKLGATAVSLRGSVGVVVAGYGDTPDSLLARADRSMYAVKRQRRATRETAAP